MKTQCNLIDWNVRHSFNFKFFFIYFQQRKYLLYNNKDKRVLRNEDALRVRGRSPICRAFFSSSSSKEYQTYSANILSTFFPWKRFSISFICWWKRSPCTSEIFQRFSLKKSKCWCKKWIFGDMLICNRWKLINMLWISSL